MKQIISFQKDIVFRTMIGEITSISLEHTLSFYNETTIRGDFIVSGTYKMTEASQIEENFEYRLPIDIEVSNFYDTKNSKIEIDDFYYEIVNDDVLKVNIDVLLNGIEKEVIEEIESKEGLLENISLDENVIKSHVEKELVRNKKEEEMLENEIPILTSELPKEEIKDDKEDQHSIQSIFSCFRDTDETFSTYSVYIVRENDTLEEIIDRYKTNRENLASYNNLEEIKVGSKLIIPCTIKND